ncbi:MAG: hypothetical protein KC445_21250, partial [Anaerolineales bacterium]|nr:hypothetical protein [Anaerolineales bacterium]
SHLRNQGFPAHSVSSSNGSLMNSGVTGPIKTLVSSLCLPTLSHLRNQGFLFLIASSSNGSLINTYVTGPIKTLVSWLWFLTASSVNAEFNRGAKHPQMRSYSAPAVRI